MSWTRRHFLTSAGVTIGGAAISGATFAWPAFSKGAKRYQTGVGVVKVEQMVDDLAHPWGVAFLPDKSILITERGGDLWVIDPSGNRRKVGGVPRVEAKGQGGLLDIVPSPNHQRDRRVFLTYARPDGFIVSETAAASAVFDRFSARLGDVRVIFKQNDARDGSRHFGSRIAFARDGTLFITTGDRGDGKMAQDPGSALGKVIRLRADGSVPGDNPIIGQGGFKGIWSMGHRNIQGAAIRPSDGRLWTVEHGAQGGDEINRPLAGLNYGWPVISYGREYSGGKIGEGTAKDGMQQPIHYWDPSIAPSGLAFYDGDQIPGWKGNLFVGALKDRKIVRLSLSGERVTAEEHLFEGAFGRIRDVRSGPDGALWFLSDARSGGLYRVTPD